MFHKVRSVSPLPGFRLSVQFEGGNQCEYNMAPLFSRWPVFQTLQQIPALFEQVRVDAGGYGISWNDDLDLSCNELWENGTPIISEKTPDAVDLH